MCGIVGLFLKQRDWFPRLGSMFSPMLIEMTNRGPDSAGVAIYSDPERSLVKLTVFSPNAGFDWSSLCAEITEALGAEADPSPVDTHCVILTDANASEVAELIEDRGDGLQVMSFGRSIEIYKETGLPDDVIRRMGIDRRGGSHAVGHTRMATESAVTTAGSHPFSTGADVCLVHNGSLSNHNWIREKLARTAGIRFRTENDTEVAAGFITSRLQAGRTLHDALEDCISELDGFYTFVAGTSDGFAVLRDPIACKPAVLAETDDFVAFGSEYRALASLPGIESASVWEPEPAIVYSWEIN